MSPDSPLRFDAIVVGGGFYGARLALMLGRADRRVLLVEREHQLMTRASLNNQARVHGGYHYPRSILTSLRSRRNYPRFVAEYRDCIDDSFKHYYAVGRQMSKVTGAQFSAFCERIGAPLAPARRAVVELFDANRIDAVFEVEECAFNAVALRDRLRLELDDAGVEVWLNTAALRVQRPAGTATVSLRRFDVEVRAQADLVLNCTYGSLNGLLEASGASPIPMKHEMTEMALVSPPPALDGAAVTVMDGPFFSLMPYPARGLFTLSHVRYTPHCAWQGAEPAGVFARRTNFEHMVHDAARYLPCMRHARYVDSLWEIKTVMPRSEQDDSRPILFRRSQQIPELVTVLGAKIDSVYDVEEALGSDARVQTPRFAGFSSTAAM